MNQPAATHPGITGTPTETTGAGGQEPVLSVVRGNPSEEELAALTAVVLGLSAPPAAPSSKQRTRSWIRRRQLRLQPAPGPGAWRRSGR